MFASSCEGLNISLRETADVVFLHLEEWMMKFGALLGYIFDNSIKLTVHNPRKKYEVFYPENDFDGIIQYNNYDVLGIYCCGEYLSIEIAHSNYVNGG